MDWRVRETEGLEPLLAFSISTLCNQWAAVTDPRRAASAVGAR